MWPGGPVHAYPHPCCSQTWRHNNRLPLCLFMLTQMMWLVKVALADCLHNKIFPLHWNGAVLTLIMHDSRICIIHVLQELHVHLEWVTLCPVDPYTLLKMICCGSIRTYFYLFFDQNGQKGGKICYHSIQQCLVFNSVYSRETKPMANIIYTVVTLATENLQMLYIS